MNNNFFQSKKSIELNELIKTENYRRIIIEKISGKDKKETYQKKLMGDK